MEICRVVWALLLADRGKHMELIRDPRFSRRWRFKSRSSGLWSRVMINDITAWRWRQQDPPKLWYPTTSLHCVTIQETAIWYIIKCKFSWRLNTVKSSQPHQYGQNLADQFLMMGTEILRNFEVFGAHPASYPMAARSSFPGGKTAGAWSWPLTSI